LCDMTENLQADGVQSRQAGFVRCCLKQKADEHLSCSPAFLC
jgi:hypothetical protein